MAGAIRGVADPNAIARDDQAGRVATQQARVGRLLSLDQIQAQTQKTQADAAYTRSRPDLDAAKLMAAQQAQARQAVLANLRLYKGQQLDPNNRTHMGLLQRAADANISVDVDSWNDAGSNLVSVDEVQADNTKRRRWFNKATGELSDVGPVTGFVQPVLPSGMTAQQEHADADRDASRANTVRHQGVMEGQGKTRIAQGNERIGISRAAGGRGSAQTNTRLARGAELNRKLEEEKNKAAHPPKMVNGVATSEAYQQGYTARHKQAAGGFAEQIRTGYGDLFEVGADADGWHWAKARVQPGAGVRAGGGGGATFTEDEVRARARAAGRDENAAVETARAHGLIRQ